MMYGYSPEFWSVDALAAGDLQAVRDLNDHAGLPPERVDVLLRAFRVLLHSADVRARGVALDEYCTADRVLWGSRSPLIGALDGELLAQARAFLAVTPESGVALHDQPTVTAGWGSAVNVLGRVAGADVDDAAMLVTVLDNALADFRRSGDTPGITDILSHTFFSALLTCLAAADESDCQAVGARLAVLVTDESLPNAVRVMALRRFQGGPTEPRLGQEDVLLRALSSDDMSLSTWAAIALIDYGTQVVAVRRAVAAWPDDAPFPAADVRRRLTDIDRLARSRATLATMAQADISDAGGAGTSRPDAIRQVRAAVYTLGEHGDSTDLDALLAVLARADLTLSGDFGTRLLAAVRRTLAGADARTCQRAGIRLAAVFGDTGLPTKVREAALRPFWDRAARAALGQADAVVDMLTDPDVGLSAAAAYSLMTIDEHAARVRRTVASWPDDVPERAVLVREYVREHFSAAAALSTPPPPARPASTGSDPQALS